MREGERKVSWQRRMGALVSGTALTIMGAFAVGNAALAAPAGQSGGVAHPPLKIKVIGRLPDGKPKLANGTPTGLSPAAVSSVYSLSGLSPSSGAGAGQIIAIVDAFHDPNALSDLNTFSSQYGEPQLSACTSLSQAGACFEQAEPASGTPRVNAGWVLEESLDIEWAHAEAPGAKIVLVEASTNSFTNLFNAVVAANKLNPTKESLRWGGGESSGETSTDADLAHPGTFYTVSSGDSGHGTQYPAASPNVISVGGTTLNGCAGTSCSGFTSETTWSGSGGGASAGERIPSYQSRYTSPVSAAPTIAAQNGTYMYHPILSFLTI